MPEHAHHAGSDTSFAVSHGTVAALRGATFVVLFQKASRDQQTSSSPGFIASVDQPLKKLVQFLQEKGISTTASCSGHNMEDRNFEQIYPDLEKDAKEIRNRGLKMKDVETGKTLVYKNKSYELPWTQEEFVKKLEAYQHKGVLGLRLGHKRNLAKALLKLKIKGVRFVKQKGTVLIFTNANKQNDIRATWKEVTEKVIEVFQK